jgi:hypothetical protein
VYLTFYYQARGYGNKPEKTDSLVLEFLDVDTSWISIWGVSVDSIAFDTFYRFDYHLSQAQFLFDGFQFRLRNYADKRGNNDHWHVDYVILDKNRSANDPLNDVAFTSPGQSLLGRYEAMPLHQFKGFQAEELRDSLHIRVRNNFTVNKNVHYDFEAWEDCLGTQVPEQNFGTIGNFPSISDATIAVVNYVSDITAMSNASTCDSLTITTRYIQDSLVTDIHYGNDTLWHDQYFGNYFAYDDGTAEQAYGVVGTGAMVAYKFHANKPDTLRAIQIHFAHVDDDPSAFLFSLVVWDSIDLTAGATGDHILYRQDFMTPEFVDSLNGFYTYFLDTAKTVSGNFWIGWQQGQSNNLGIGYDANHDAGAQTFYNLSGSWFPSQLHGAMMLRPALGDPFTVHTGGPSLPELARVRLYPNPSSGQVVVSASTNFTEVILIDAMGRTAVTAATTASTSTVVDISALPAGMYFVQVMDRDGGVIGHQRLVKVAP